jgi:hypothetical protein
MRTASLGFHNDGVDDRHRENYKAIQPKTSKGAAFGPRNSCRDESKSGVESGEEHEETQPFHKANLRLEMAIARNGDLAREMPDGVMMS